MAIRSDHDRQVVCVATMLHCQTWFSPIWSLWRGYGVAPLQFRKTISCWVAFVDLCSPSVLTPMAMDMAPPGCSCRFARATEVCRAASDERETPTLNMALLFSVLRFSCVETLLSSHESCSASLGAFLPQIVGLVSRARLFNVPQWPKARKHSLVQFFAPPDKGKW